MAAAWKTVRVFISSTFRDMHAERDHLVKVVFPALRERLEKHRIHLVDIDLRWGVTREQAENYQALNLCLQQIDECRPFFIGILGERYGWVPTRYPADALKRFGWIQHHTGKSVTELEILHGVLQDSKMRGRAFFYFRDQSALHEIPETCRLDVYADSDPECVQKLKDLKQQILSSGYPVFGSYPARWDAEAYDRPSRSKGRLVGLEAFGERVREQLWEAIKAEQKLPDTLAPDVAADPLAEEQDYHERFMESRLRVYVGREQINDALFSFANGNDLVPCLVTGPSGSGKSAALARFVRDYSSKHQQEINDSTTLIVPHFIGASPRSTNLRDMLRRFCQVLNARFGFAEDVPDEVPRLSVTFREFVDKVPADTRVLLVIDALNQLDEGDRAQELYWLRTALPPNVKVIISCIADSGKTETALEAFGRHQHASLTVGPLDDEERRKIIQQVPSLSAKALDDHQVEQLLANPATTNPLFLLVALEELRGFGSYERLNERIAAFPREGDTVTEIFTQVIERLEEEFDVALVQTVLTSLDAARRGLSERELQRLTARMSGAGDLFGVLRQLRPYLLWRGGLIDFYHRNLTHAVWRRYLATAAESRTAHARLAEFFGAQPAREPDGTNIRRADELVWQYLRAGDAPSAERLLTDLPFLEVKADAGLTADLIVDLADLLQSMPADAPSRRIVRLVRDAIRLDLFFLTRHPGTMFQCLWNRCWWYDCPAAAEHYAEPAGGWEGEGPPWDHAGLKLFALLEQWRREKEQTTPGFVWARSLRPPESPLETGLESVLIGHAGPVTGVAFSPLADHIASASADGTVRIWDTVSGRELVRHEGANRAVAYSADGRHILSTNGSTVCVWLAGGGGDVDRFRADSFEILCLACSPDGRFVVTGSADGITRVWELAERRQVSAVEAKGGNPDPFTSNPHGVVGVAFSPDGQRIVCVAGDVARTWAVPVAGAGRVLTRPRTVETKLLCAAYAPNGRGLAIGGADRTVRLMDSVTGRLWAKLRAHDHPVTAVAFSPDGRRLVSASAGGELIVWDAARGEVLTALEGPENAVHSVAFSPDGKRLATGSVDGVIRLWSGWDGMPRLREPRRKGTIRHLTFSDDGGWLGASGEDGIIYLLDVNRGVLLARLPELFSKTAYGGNPIHGVECRLRLLRGGSRLLMSAKGGATSLWEIPSGKLLGAGDYDESWSFGGVSPDGTKLLLRHGEMRDDGSFEFDWSYKVWGVETGRSCYFHLLFHSASEFTTVPAARPAGAAPVVEAASGETVVKSPRTGEILAWLPFATPLSEWSASRRTWAVNAAGRTHVYQLEGGEVPW